jgi:hypothetical protein
MACGYPLAGHETPGELLGRDQFAWIVNDPCGRSLRVASRERS